MPYVPSGSGGSGGTVKWFADAAARDAYYTSNPNELKNGVSVGVGNPVVAYTYDGTNWIQGALAFKGDEGFSPTVVVKSSTSTEYILTITDAQGAYDTPNLKGQDGAGSEAKLPDFISDHSYLKDEPCVSNGVLYRARADFGSVATFDVNDWEAVGGSSSTTVDGISPDADNVQLTRTFTDADDYENNKANVPNGAFVIILDGSTPTNPFSAPIIQSYSQIPNAPMTTFTAQTTQTISTFERIEP